MHQKVERSKRAGHAGRQRAGEKEQSPVSKQVPWRHWILSAADTLLLLCWKSCHKAAKCHLPLAVDVVPDELDADSLLQEALDQQVGICIPLPRIAIHHAEDLSMPTKRCSQGSDVILHAYSSPMQEGS